MPTQTKLLKAKKIPKAQFGGNVNPFGLKTIRSIQNPAPQLASISQLNIPQLASGPNMNSLASGPKISGGDGEKEGGYNVGAAITGAADLGMEAIDAFSKPGVTNTWGITKQNSKATVGKSTLAGVGKGASAGAAAGAILGPVGSAIGAGVGGLVGGIVGLFKGKKKAKADNKEYLDNTQAAYESYNQKAAAQQYAALAKHGTKLAIMKSINDSKKGALSFKSRKFKVGGKLEKLGEVNIIPSGTLHKENNNLGQKDKGIPIIDGEGKKVFEVEREELILRLTATKAVEDSVDKYKKSHNDKHLVDLGKFLTKEITTNTHDFSGRYGLEVA